MIIEDRISGYHYHDVGRWQDVLIVLRSSYSSYIFYLFVFMANACDIMITFTLRVKL